MVELLRLVVVPLRALEALAADALPELPARVQVGIRRHASDAQLHCVVVTDAVLRVPGVRVRRVQRDVRALVLLLDHLHDQRCLLLLVHDHL